MKNKKKVLLTFFLIGLGVTGIFLYKKNFEGKKVQTYKEVKTKIHDLKVTIQATGNVEPLNKVQIMPPVAGRMEKIMIKEGQKVKRGEVIGLMSSTNRAALLDFARTIKKKDLIKWKEIYKPTPIVAPVDGLIISKRVVPGQTIGPQSILFEISDKLVVRAQVDETDIGKIKEKMNVEFSIDAYPGKNFVGVVSLIAHQSQLVNSVNIYHVEIISHVRRPASSSSEEVTLRSGMTANVEFVIFKKMGALGIPNWAVQGLENQDFHLLDLQKKNRTLKLGRSDGQFVEVLHGAKEGETFLIPTFTVQEPKKSFSPFARNNKKKRGNKKEGRH